MKAQKPVEAVVAAIEALDLDPIKFKLMDAEEGEGWSREQVDRIELAYRQFLTLLVKHPETTIAPSKEVDRFWHGHILDTMKYAEDCEQVFGYFLHHFPYFGMRGKEDAAQLEAAGKETRRLMEAEFGAAAGKASYCFAAKPTNEAGYCFASKPSYCFAAKPATEAAYCFASRPSYCFAAKPATEAAYCFASKPSYCFAAKGVEQTAYCFKASAGTRVDITSRPKLAIAA